MLQIFLDYSVYLQFRASCSLSWQLPLVVDYFLIFNVLWWTIFRGNCLLGGRPLIPLPGLWKFCSQLQMLLSGTTEATPVQARFYISFSASVSPLHVWVCKLTLQPWQGQHSLLEPQAESLRTASQTSKQGSCAPFHCGDTFARVLDMVLVPAVSSPGPEAMLPVLSWLFKP